MSLTNTKSRSEAKSTNIIAKRIFFQNVSFIVIILLKERN